MPRDLVCGMQVEEDSAPARSEYEGQIYLFCTEGCKDRFEENPGEFIERFRSEQANP